MNVKTVQAFSVIGMEMEVANGDGQSVQVGANGEGVLRVNRNSPRLRH